MTFRDMLRSQRSEIIQIAKRHGGRNIHIFGSVARGDDTPDSDLDLLIELGPDCNLIDHIAIQQDLEDFLKKKVDVVEQDAIHPLMKEQVLSEAVPL